jgi:hypothetical protein
MPLKAFRFRYDPILEQILDASHTLRVTDPAGPFETGRHVQKIQQALIDEGGIYRQGFRTFLATTLGTANPDAAAFAAGATTFRPRVDRFNDLFALGPVNALLSLTPPPPKTWIFTSTVIGKFFQMLAAQLAVETNRFD